jgi:hypothetical protein
MLSPSSEVPEAACSGWLLLQRTAAAVADVAAPSSDTIAVGTRLDEF